jgi:hypothetical protein
MTNKWEYEWIRPGHLSPRKMNEMGADGWEYVGELGGDWAVFKRPVKPVTLVDEIRVVRAHFGDQMAEVVEEEAIC